MIKGNDLLKVRRKVNDLLESSGDTSSFKTINGESVVGEGNIVLPTESDLTDIQTDIVNMSKALANKADLATNEILKLDGSNFSLVSSDTGLTQVEYALASGDSVEFECTFDESTSFSIGDEFNLNLYADGGSNIFNVELTAEIYNSGVKIGEVSRSLGVSSDYKSYNLSILLDVDSTFSTTDTFTLTLTGNADINLLLGSSIESSYLKFPTTSNSSSGSSSALYRHSVYFTDADDNSNSAWFEFYSSNGSTTANLNLLLYEIGAISINTMVAARGSFNDSTHKVTVGVYSRGESSTQTGVYVVISDTDYSSFASSTITDSDASVQRTVTQIL